MKKAFIFDFDGTIADTIPSDKKISELFNVFAEKEHLPQRITPTDVAQFREDHLFTSIRKINLPLWKIPFLLKKVRKTFKSDILLSLPVKQIKETLQELKKHGVLLGIVSSTSQEVIEEFLKQYNLDFFDFVHSAKNLFGKDKVLKSVLKKYNLHPLEAMYVGDEIRDIDATKKVGIPMVAVTWGFNNKQGLLNHSPKFIIEKPKDLLLKQILQ